MFGNANLADVDTEQKVVDSVGSYGYQLNRVIDALAVLIRERQDPTSSRTEEDRRMLYRLLDLADAADKAAKRPRPHNRSRALLYVRRRIAFRDKEIRETLLDSITPSMVIRVEATGHLVDESTPNA